MSRRPYRLTGPIGSRATFGLIVLQVDETIEHDFRRLFDMPDIALHVSRIPSGAHLTPETIATMETTLPAAAALLPTAARFDAVGYACTSGATLIGADRVASLVHGATTTGAVTDPLTAALAALRALNAHAVALRAGEDATGFVAPSLLPGRVPPSPPVVVDGTFGAGFHAQVSAVAPGGWAGPVQSAYGRHLVRVLSVEPPHLPPLAEIRDTVERDWRSTVRARLAEERFNTLAARYDIVRPDPAVVLAE